MAKNELTYDVVIKTKLGQIESEINKLSGKLDSQAQKAGKQAGQSLGNSFRSAALSIISGISFQSVISGILNAATAQIAYQRSTTRITQAVGAYNRSQIKNNQILADSTSTLEQKAMALGLDTTKMYENTRATQSNAGTIKNLDRQITQLERNQEDSLRVYNDLITAKETDSRISQNQIKIIDDQIDSLKKETQARIKLLRTQRGGDILDDELKSLEIQKNQLEIQRDEAKVQGDFIQADFIGIQISGLNDEISLRKNKLDAIEFETDAIEEQANIEKQKLEETRQAAKQKYDSIVADIERVRIELEADKNQFDIDIEPARRKLEDLRATSVSIGGGQVVKQSFLDAINQGTEEALKEAPKQISEADFTALQATLFDRFEGTINRTSLASAISDLVSSGVTDISDAEEVIGRFADIAASGGSPVLTLGEKVAQLGEQFRFERAQLGESAGLTEEYISDIIPSGTAQLGLYNRELTDQERVQAKISGLLEITNNRQGAFNEQLEDGNLELDKSKGEFDEVVRIMGKDLLPTLVDILKVWSPLLLGFGIFVSENPGFVTAIAGVALAFSGIATIVNGINFLLGGSGVGSAIAGVSAGAGAKGGLLGLLGSIGAVITGPIGIAIAAILLLIGVFVLAYNNVERFRDFVDTSLEQITEWFEWASENWVEALGQVLGFMISLPFKMGIFAWQAIWAIINTFKNADWGEMWKGLLDSLFGVGRAIEKFFREFNWRGLGNGFIDFIKGLLRGVSSGIPGADLVINPIIEGLPRFAKGGTFTVEGQSGVDKNLIQFMATKGERVIVQPRNEVNNNSNTTTNYINYGDTVRSGPMLSFVRNF